MTFNPRKMNLAPAIVELEGSESRWPCFLDPDCHWNGWGMPYFTREIAAKVLEDTETFTTGTWRYDPTDDCFYVVNSDYPGEPPEAYPAVDTPHGTLYGIGAGFGCWVEVKP